MRYSLVIGKICAGTAGLLLFAGCMVGPNHQPPSTEVAPAWLELQPAGFAVQPATKIGRASCRERV